MWQFSYRPEVEDDVVAAIAWYDGKRPGLGEEFFKEYLAALMAGGRDDSAFLNRGETTG